jgi:hypothetical protein
MTPPAAGFRTAPAPVAEHPDDAVTRLLILFLAVWKIRQYKNSMTRSGR